MFELDLNYGLSLPPCPRCAAGIMRVTDWEGHRVLFNCTSHWCRWRGWWELPQIKKTLIYLDTSTVSHMAKSAKKGTDPRWRRLLDALEDAVADEAVSCVVSPISRREFQFSSLAEEFVALGERLNDPGLHHDLDVRYAQLYRAVDRFLHGCPPELEVEPPASDALIREPHSWHPLFKVHLNQRDSDEITAAARTTKESIHQKHVDIHAAYAQEGLTLEAIRDEERKGFGRGLVEESRRSIAAREAVKCGLASPTACLGDLLPSTADVMAAYIRQELGIDYASAMTKAFQFLRSHHAISIPIADIGATLHASVAMASRGKTPRQPKSSDHIDVDHISTYMPYVDIFITDGFFAEQCKRLDLGSRYKTQVRSLGATEVASFIVEISKLVTAAPQSQLARRMHQSLKDGGYLEERAKMLNRSWISRR